MSPMPPQKPSFEEFIKTCTPLLKIPELEERMRARMREIVGRLLRFETGNDNISNIKQFLQEDKEFLGIMLSLSGLSQEKFLRILTAERFSQQDYDPEWGIKKVISKLKSDDAFAEKIARLFLEGRDNDLLIEQVADFYLDQLSLSENWTDIIRNENSVMRVVRQKLTGEYTDQKGEYIENIINNTLDATGACYEKGQAPLLGKEIDHAIPSCQDPYIAVMSSYQETTSSSQTARANEQRDMYRKLRENNERYPNRAARVMVNVVDGGGWLARRSDLRKMHASCDYCLNMKTLEQLKNIITHHLPKK